MSSKDVAISVRDLAKSYIISHNTQRATTMAEALIHRLKSPVQRTQKETFWALKDVSFDVNEGEAVAIIGRNGAGKSTLLKILSRITLPTTGKVEVYGRMGSLLEVGTGFHPELTGRENIYLNGAILGMKRKEIDKQFDAIVDFAEIEQFLDTPVKRYSSGMYVRLAFAVAAHLNPEILVVDEVLAVGDATFQKKCLGNMEDVARTGRTVLFVSHNMTAVQNLCNHAIWLRKGTLMDNGPVQQVIANYLKAGFSNATAQTWENPEMAPGNELVRFHRVCVRPQNGSPDDHISVRSPLVMEFEYWNLEPGAYLNLSILIINELGATVFNTGNGVGSAWHGRPFPAGLFRSVCHVPGDLLNDGRHSVTLLVVKNQSVIIYNYDDALSFEVEDAPEMRSGWYGKWPGVVRPLLHWTTEILEPDVLAQSEPITQFDGTE